MNKKRLLSTDILFKNRNKKNNNLNEKQKNTLSFTRTFSLNNIKIKINNKQSIEIIKNKKRAFSPKNKVEILEKQIEIFKNGNLFHSLQNLSNLKRKKGSLQKKVTSLKNDINQTIKINKYKSANKYLIKKNNEKIKNILSTKKENTKQIEIQKSEDENSLNLIRINIRKKKVETQKIKENYVKITREINELNEEIKNINKKKIELIKEKNIIFNEINNYKKKIEKIKIDIDKYDKLSDRLLNSIEIFNKFN